MFETLQFEYLVVILYVPIPVLVVQIAILQKQPLKLPTGPMSHPRWKLTTQFIYHVYMIEIVMHVKQQLPCYYLDQDAADRPHITEFIPLAALQDHFWASVLPGIYHLTVGVVFVGGPSEIYQLYLLARRQENTFISPLGFLEGGRAEQDVLGFEVGVRVALKREVGDCLEELPGEGADMPVRETYKFIFFDKFVQGEPESLEDDAVVVAMVEVLDVPDDMVVVKGIIPTDLLDDGTLGPGRIGVLLDRLYYLTLPKVTFIAYFLPSKSPSTTLPNVPVPSRAVTLYL